jgi:predicted RNA-binding protein with PIN domain
MKEMILVDGYNVIYAWPELIALREDLEYARDKLLEMLSGYGVFKNQQIAVVFDAHAVPGAHERMLIVSGLEVVYTSENETADSYIERETYELVRAGRRVFVVTSDYAEQMVVLGAGAYRISAKEFLREVKRVSRLMEEQYARNVLSNRRHEVENRLSQDVINRLEQLRKQK